MEKIDIINEYRVLSNNLINDMRDNTENLMRFIRLNIVKELENNNINPRDIDRFFGGKIDDILYKAKSDINQKIINRKEQQYGEQLKLIGVEMEPSIINSKKNDIEEQYNRQINAAITEIIDDTMIQLSNMIKSIIRIDSNKVLNRYYQMLQQTVGIEYTNNMRQFDGKIKEKLEQLIQREIQEKDTEQKNVEVTINKDNGFIEEKSQIKNNRFIEEESLTKGDINNITYDELSQIVIAKLENELNKISMNISNEINRMGILSPQLMQAVNNSINNMYDRMYNAAIKNRKELEQIYKNKGMKMDLDDIANYEDFYIKNVSDIKNCIYDIIKSEFDKQFQRGIGTIPPTNISQVYNELENSMRKNYTEYISIVEEQIEILKSEYSKTQDKTSNIKELEQMKEDIIAVKQQNASIQQPSDEVTSIKR